MINLTPRFWDRRTIPGFGLSPRSDAKHLRLVFNPDDGCIWNIGGDWSDMGDVGSGEQTIYKYDVALDPGLGNGLGWTRMLPFCPPTGTAGPGRPDQVTAVWDSNRHVIWCVPGYMPANGQTPEGATVAIKEQQLAVALSQGGSETEIFSTQSLAGWAVNVPSSAIAIVNEDLTFEYILYDGVDTTTTPHKFLNCQRGYGGTPKGAHAVGEWYCRAGYSPCGPRTTPRVSLPWTGFSLDPVTSTWKIRTKINRTINNASMAPGEFSSNGFYDAVGDKIIRITGGTSINVRTFSLPSLDSTSQTFTGLGGGSTGIGNNDIAWDPEGRHAYIIQPGINPAPFLRYDPDTQTMTKITGTGAPPRFTIPQGDGTIGINCFYPKWDTINKKVLWPFVYNFAGGSEDPVTTTTSICRLYIYHPTTNTWDVDAMQPGGPPYQRGNSWVFNSKENCLMGMGRSQGQMWLYRYASTSPSHRPVGLQTVTI